jgi:hypothetical protein
MCRRIGERCVSEGTRLAKFAVTAILSYINLRLIAHPLVNMCIVTSSTCVG